ncbi:MAG: hypothetical protein ACR2QV_05815 [Gammaproteobacteria bacterium]
MFSHYLRRIAALCCGVLLMTACAGPQVTRVQALPADSGAPFENILVVTLFADFGARKTLEKRIVSLLAERGTKAVASTSMMDTKTPMTREVYIAMLDKIGADSMLVTQLVSVDTELKAVDANPQTTVEVRPTYYFNVWNVNVTEYVEPQFLYDTGTASLATQMLSVAKRDAVWGIESTIEIKREVGVPRDYGAHDVESGLIVNYLVRDGLIK